MDCTLTQALTDPQLIASIEGEADPAVIAHLATCPACRQRVHQLSQAEARFRTLFSYAERCPSRAELEQYYLGELPTIQEAAIAAHLRNSCADCQMTVAAIMQRFAGLAPDELAEAQPLLRHGPRQAENFAAFLTKLKGLNAAGAPSAPEPSTEERQPNHLADTLQRVKERIAVFIAELVATPTLAPALRGDADKLPLIYRAGEIEIRVDLQPELGTDRKVLIGQVKVPPPALADLQVYLRQGEQTIASAPVEGRRGRFQLPALPPGDYALVVRSAQWEVQIPQLACR